MIARCFAVYRGSVWKTAESRRNGAAGTASCNHACRPGIPDYGLDGKIALYPGSCPATVWNGGAASEASPSPLFHRI